ncbi:MAG TPA: preprotein translocase subunit SecA [Alcanivoracaceae bacterium]|nr:preprotein translocase subunit SecA [Alcanivoracaceae bacterium]
MLSSIVTSIFGSKNKRELKRMQKIVNEINRLGESLAELSNEELQAYTPLFKQQFEEGKSLDELLPEAYAVCREASVRVMGMRHFDVQLLGGIALHEGRIAEMKTGEGKTLTATLPVYLNALSGKGVHVVTVNDYLAERDANWMRPLYEFLGLSVGIIKSQQPTEEKRAAYVADITYGTNNEYGFDYLRDNMAFRLEDKVQRGLNFAVVDEVDSILIDEARTPLIISGPAADSSELYIRINKMMPQLKQAFLKEDEKEPTDGGHYLIDEQSRQVELTEVGHQRIEELLVEAGLLEEGDSLYSAQSLSLLHHVHAALKACVLFERDRDYIVQNGEIVIVDEHTGRTMPGRRWSEGIHQAVEAKEGVHINQENQTLASTTFQNYFRLYNKLSGMTGTADTEAPEFIQIYGLDVVVIPTHKPMARVDHQDLVYLTVPEKYDAIVEAIQEAVAKKAPVLVGTATIASSEYLSQRLNKEGIEHKVLNAKFHEQEAQIIAQAGRPGRVTIATNMAGRGTDIVLGGNPEEMIKGLENPTDEEKQAVREQCAKDQEFVKEIGGLHIIGTERHESRRIDNQLRGRAGRQGDPGDTRFFLSMDDDLMRIFASDRIRGMMRSLGLEKGEAIQHRWITRAIENAQRKVEGRNFDIRKNLLEYDDVANEQRTIIYKQRNAILEADDLSSSVIAIREDVAQGVVHSFMPPGSIEEQWDIEGLEKALAQDFHLELDITTALQEDHSLHIEDVVKMVLDGLTEAYAQKEADVEEMGISLRKVEKHMMLQVLDKHWKEHLASMDHLRQGIHLRSYAQRNPKQEYQAEAFELFQGMLGAIEHEFIRVMSTLQLRVDDEERLEAEREAQAQRQAEQMRAQQAELPAAEQNIEAPEQPAQPPQAQQPVVRQGRKIGRNEPCHCGSGKKYKHCHGKLN